MRIFRAFTLVLVAALASTGAPAQSTGGTVEFVTIVRSTGSGITGARDQVIASTEAWARFWEELYPEADSRPPLPEVAFDRRMVVVAALGQEPSSNYDIEITKLVRAKGVSDGLPLLRVLVTETRPSQRCFPGPAGTQPIHIVETDRFTDVTFRRVQKTDRCGR